MESTYANLVLYFFSSEKVFDLMMMMSIQLLDSFFFLFFLVIKKWVERVIIVASLLGCDYSSTLPDPRRDPIILICEKLTYYLLDRLDVNEI